ncbi:MAG: FAD-binding protein [Clostridiaceae bacterium]|nr:FAD-binding protein [Clostridiaceae bacterium]
MSYDIAIIGGGPAGANLARLLDRNYKVLLLDRRDLVDGEDEKRTKCCGGLLAPDAQQMLGRMGLAVPIDVLVDPQLFLVRTIDFDNSLERYYQRFYFNMDRKRFDEWLISLVPGNVDMAMGCRFTALSEFRDGYEIAFIFKNRIYTEKAKVIVGADGAWSKVRQQIYGEKRRPVRKYIAIQEWYETEETTPHYYAIFDSQITDFYSWTISKNGKLIIGSALDPERDAKEKFELLKHKLKEYGLKFENCQKREGAYIIRPKKNDLVTGNDHAALIGEAGCFISPSSAEGLSYAFKSSYALAQSLNEGIEGFQQRYKKRARSIARNIWLKQAKSIVMYNKTLRKLVMKSGILSSDVLF